MRLFISLLLLVSSIFSYSQAEPYLKDKKRRDKWTYYPGHRNPYDDYCYVQTNQRRPRRYPVTSGFNMTIGVLGNVAIDNTDAINCFGTYLSAGSDRFRFMLGYSDSGFKRYPYYSEISYNQVLAWQDNEIQRFDRFSDIFFAAVFTNRYQINPIIGFGFEYIDQVGVFFDEYFILSNTGEYAISIDQETDINVKIGVEKNIGHLNIMAIYSISKTSRALIGVGFYF